MINLVIQTLGSDPLDYHIDLTIKIHITLCMYMHMVTSSIYIYIYIHIYIYIYRERKTLLGLWVPGWVPDPALQSARNPRARTKKQDPTLNPAWKLGSRARPRAPAWNSGIEWHMYLRIPIEIRDAALNPGWDTGLGTGSQLLPCRLRYQK